MPIWLTITIIALTFWENAWCQSTRPTSAAELAKYIGADRERMLYDGGKKDGKLLWYTSLSSYKEVAKAFETKYPGVTVEFYRAAGTTLATRILSESSARRYLADAFETTPGATMLLRDNKVLLPYNSPHLSDYPDGSKEKAPGGLVFATVDRESYPGIGYNRTVIRDAKRRKLSTICSNPPSKARWVLAAKKSVPG